MEKNLLTILSVALIVIAILVIGIYYFNQNTKNQETNMNQQNQDEQNNQTSVVQEIKIEIIKEGEGEGEAVKSGDQITVNYVGTLEDGTVFDSSIERKQPFPFTVGMNSVIQGWEIGVIGMKVGETRKLTIPPQLAYGERGVSGVIPPNSILIFEISLLKIN